MFNKIIPMDMLAQLPLPFVHRLRDIRIKQIEEANKHQEAMMNNPNYVLPPNARGVDHAMFNGTAIDDIIDELQT